MWLHRNELSRNDKMRRAVYRTLRDELDYYLVQYALVDSYKRFLDAGREFPFVERRELRPRSKITEVENELINGFIVIFSEDSIPNSMKKYIRCFDTNKVTKENLAEIAIRYGNVAETFQQSAKYFEKSSFYNLIKELLPVDYALLIQQDTSVKTKTRFQLSHFHVRIDWLIDSAAESLGKELRYVSKDLYEKGDKYSQLMVEKFFEYYSFHHTVSGRRTATSVAAQLLKELPFYSTIWVSSSEARTLTKISERDISKYTLIKLAKEQIEYIEKHPNCLAKDFRKNYLIHEEKDFGVAILNVIYAKNEHSKSPQDGKLRELKADVQWLRVINQLIMPKPEVKDERPFLYQTVYDQSDPMSRS